PPQHRYHQKAARAVLKALLPESGTDIKGHLRSHAELLAASGYANRPRDFEDLLRILDSEIRLLTPTDPEGAGEDTPTRSASAEPLARSASAEPLATSASEVLSVRRVSEGPSPSLPALRSKAGERYYQLTHDYLVPSLREWLTRKQKETR